MFKSFEGVIQQDAIRFFLATVSVCNYARRQDARADDGFSVTLMTTIRFVPHFHSTRRHRFRHNPSIHLIQTRGAAQAHTRLFVLPYSSPTPLSASRRPLALPASRRVGGPTGRCGRNRPGARWGFWVPLDSCLALPRLVLGSSLIIYLPCAIWNLPPFLLLFTDLAPIDSAVGFAWLLNQGTATAMLGQQEILLEFSRHTSSTAGRLPPPDLVKKNQFSFLLVLCRCCVMLHGWNRIHIYGPNCCSHDFMCTLCVWFSVCFFHACF